MERTVPAWLFVGTVIWAIGLSFFGIADSPHFGLWWVSLPAWCLLMKVVIDR